VHGTEDIGGGGGGSDVITGVVEIGGCNASGRMGFVVETGGGGGGRAVGIDGGVGVLKADGLGFDGSTNGTGCNTVRSFSGSTCTTGGGGGCCGCSTGIGTDSGGLANFDSGTGMLMGGGTAGDLMGGDTIGGVCRVWLK